MSVKPPYEPGMTHHGARLDGGSAALAVSRGSTGRESQLDPEKEE